MHNHIHVLWQILDPYTLLQIVHSFQSFTSKEIIQDLDQGHLQAIKVNKRDRLLQVWKMSPLSVEIISPVFFRQKLIYIHKNPARSQIQLEPKYCSNSAYLNARHEHELLTFWSGML